MGQQMLSRLLRGLLLGLLASSLWLAGIAPSLASVHTYHERPGQTTYRSQQSLRDQADRAWQATLFKRYVGSDLQGIYLRLVGFPGQVTVDSAPPLQVDTGVGRRWQAPPALDLQTPQLPDSVGQYDFQAVLSDLTSALPLKLTVPLQGHPSAQLTAAPFVVEEWRQLRDLTSED